MMLAGVFDTRHHWRRSRDRRDRGFLDPELFWVFGLPPTR